MDQSLITLKEEINQTSEAQHDLAKWKLAVTAVLGAAAFGFGKEVVKADIPSYWLLLFIPFVCAYIDLFDYQYELRTLVIARFLRHSGAGDTLQKYEQECEQQRGLHTFSLGKFAVLSSSIGASVVGPVFYFVYRNYAPDRTSLLVPLPVAIAIWSVGVVIIVGLWIYFHHQAKEISKGEQQGWDRERDGTPGPTHGPELKVSAARR